MGGTLYAVSSPFGLGTGDASSEWQMLAAEAVGLQNQILWRNNPGNFLHLWNLDASWSWQSSSGNFAPSSAAALGLETSFQLDLNGNGVIG
jgi:serralysin